MPAEASVGTNSAVIVNEVGAVNQYPRAKFVKVLVCPGRGIVTGAVLGLIEGVTVTVATTGALVLLVALKLAILPAPLAPRPMEVVLFVQA